MVLISAAQDYHHALVTALESHKSAWEIRTETGHAAPGGTMKFLDIFHVQEGREGERADETSPSPLHCWTEINSLSSKRSLRLSFFSPELAKWPITPLFAQTCRLTSLQWPLISRIS